MVELVLARRGRVPWLILTCGGALVLVGVLALRSPTAPLSGGVGTLVVAGLLVAWAGLMLVRRSPRLRANEAGLWLGGGRVIPWHAIRAISAGVQTQFVISKSAFLYIELHRTRTILRTPMRYWIGALLEGLHVSLEADEGPAMVGAKLEAMRVSVSGLDGARRLSSAE